MNHIPFEERKRVYASALRKFGADKQAVKALEELSEVTKEICKTLLGEGNREHLAEELADATIMLEQLRQIFNVNESTLTWIDYKISELKRKVSRCD